MAVRIDETTFSEPLAMRLRASTGEGAVVLHWLGQAGFVVSTAGRRIVIDPYLSDSLAINYRNSPTPHERMMSAPTTVEGLGPVDLVLVTHQHTDHMDPGTLAPLAAANPRARFIVPAASLDEASRRADADPDRFDPVDAGDAVEPWPGFGVSAVRAYQSILRVAIITMAMTRNSSNEPSSSELSSDTNSP